MSYRNLIAFHSRHGAIATIAAYSRDVTIDLGVLKVSDEGTLLDYVEKPRYEFMVSMGIYCFDPRVCDFVGRDERISMPNLILRLRSKGECVRCYGEECYWLDIGRPGDYAAAIEEFRRDRSRFLPPPDGD
jgi:NDP-sugar pyrophosphorylase family protein